MVAGLSTIGTNLQKGFDSFKTHATSGLSTLKNGLETGYAHSKTAAKYSAHEFLDSTVKVIDFTKEALHTTAWVAAGAVTLDWAANGKFSEANTGFQGTATYKVLDAAGFRNSYTTDKGLVQSLQVPAAIILALVAEPAVSGTLEWLKGKVVQLNAKIPA